MLYEHKCFECEDIAVVCRLMANRNDPYTCLCGGETERIWSIPYVTPESMYVAGGIVSKGRKVLVNDCDDPWESVPGLNSDMSEEFVAKGKELRRTITPNWGT